MQLAALTSRSASVDVVAFQNQLVVVPWDESPAEANLFATIDVGILSIVLITFAGLHKPMSPKHGQLMKGLVQQQES